MRSNSSDTRRGRFPGADAGLSEAAFLPGSARRYHPFAWKQLRGPCTSILPIEEEIFGARDQPAGYQFLEVRRVLDRQGSRGELCNDFLSPHRNADVAGVLDVIGEPRSTAYSTK